MKKQIYIWDNTGTPSWHVGIAICEDGHVLAQHCSSTLAWLKNDMGLNPEICKWKHDKYEAHCPDGYELVFVEHTDPRLEAALEKNKLLPPKKLDPFVEVVMSDGSVVSVGP